MGNGQELYIKAKAMIPGGTQLLSKRPEMFLPDEWPSYYNRAKGVEVWDLDGNKYIDMSYNGIGSCILGAADPDVDEAVIKVINSGSMSTLNAPEEVELAGLLCELHPWADMVRYARSGGEAMAVAVRIARAKTGRDRVAFCGYHGWHDWYLAANLADDRALDGHLLPGLEPAGVPRALIGTALPFRYNHIEELKAIVSRYKNELAAIVMEPIRDHNPDAGFLECKNLTAEMREKVATERISSLPLDKALKIGNGPKKIIEFTDPDCPYCRKVDNFLSKRTDVTRYVYFVPLRRIHPDAEKKARYILSQSDKGKAFHDVFEGVLDGKSIPIADGVQQQQLEEMEKIAAGIGVRGTPALWIEGAHVNGADIQRISGLLDKGKEVSKPETH